MMDKAFPLDLLLRALRSEKELIATWAAYQLLTLFPAETGKYLQLFLDSPFEDIQEAGIAKVGELKEKTFSISLLQFFRGNNNRLKQAAAISLSSIPNDLFFSSLQKWFEAVIHSENTTRTELANAGYAVLKSSATAINLILKYLEEVQEDLIKSTTLFKVSLPFGNTQKEINRLVDQYFILRDIHSDVELIKHLIALTGNAEFVEWLVVKLNSGVSMVSVYEQCFQVLSLGIPLKERQVWYELDKTLQNDAVNQIFITKNLDDIVNHIVGLVNRFHSVSGLRFEYQRLLWILEGFQRNHKYLSDTIPKIQELECAFILSIPVLIALGISVERWLTYPKDHLEQIAKVYHSSLLTSSSRENILGLFFPEPPQWTKEELTIRYENSPIQGDETTHDILWLLYRGEFLGYDISWASFFPSPDVSVHLISSLYQVYFHNFEYYLNKGDRVSIDYALQLFQLSLKKETIPLLKKHFEYLNQVHTDIFLQTIEYIPDVEFIDLFADIYQPEEFEIAELIIFLCEIFEQPIPKKLEQDSTICGLQKGQISNKGSRTRLRCETCGKSYRYPIRIIYVDEEALHLTSRLESKAVWTPERIQCKNCKETIPFHLDFTQLEEIATQSRLERILHLNSENKRNHLGQRIRLISFPTYEGKTYTPGEFEQLLQQYEEDQEFPHDTLTTLRFRLAELYEMMEQYEKARQTLSRIQPDDRHKIRLWLRLGIVHYQLSMMLEARQFFSHVVNEFKGKVMPEIFRPYIKNAKRYLEIMDSAKEKRARFRVINGKG